MIRRTGQVFGLLIVMIALGLLVLALLPGPWLARQVAALASSHLELSVDMAGLKVTPFSLTPSATIQSLNMTQASGAVRLHAAEASVSLNLSALFRGELLLDRLRFSDGGLQAVVDEQGQGNWLASGVDEKRPGIAPLLQALLSMKIDDLVLDSFNVRLVNEQFGTELSLDVDAVASTYDADKISRAHMEGHANAQVVNADIEFASLGEVLKLPALGNAPISIDLKASVGDDQLSFKGSVGKPASMQDVNAVFSARISSLEHWQAFVPMRLPDLPALALAGVLTRGNEDWLLRQLDWRIGKTDFSGEVRADTSRLPVKLDARITSAQLAIDELMQLQGIQLMPLPFNGSIDFSAQRVVSDTWPVTGVDLGVELDDQWLTVLINRLQLRGGELEGEIIRELNAQPVITQIRLHLKRLDLQQLVPERDGGSPRVGQMAASIDLSMAGGTAQSMRSTANGVVVALMTGDWLESGLEAVFGVELARSLIVDRGVPAKAAQECALLELQAVEGIVQLRSLVFETDTVVYLGDGEFDWQNQTIDLTMEPHFKKVQANNEAADAVYVSGPLSAPVVESVHPFLTRDSAVAILDATVSPAVSLMPYLNENADGSDVACQGMASALDDPR